MSDMNSLLRSYFDFEYEDQPDELIGYSTAIHSMWNYAKMHGITEDLRDYLEKMLESDDDSASEIGFNFLPGKHEVDDIIRLSLEEHSKI